MPAQKTAREHEFVSTVRWWWWWWRRLQPQLCPREDCLRTSFTCKCSSCSQSLHDDTSAVFSSADGFGR
jgi:hypothetical protein